MIKDATFFEDEEDSPLLSRGLDFLKKDPQAHIARVQSWVDLLPGAADVKVDVADVEKCNEEHFIRIFRRDAERTWIPKEVGEPAFDRTKARQDKHVNNLRLVVNTVRDYHQGMGYIVAFLGIFLEPAELAKISLALHREPKYSAGYFKAEPENFVRDAKVMNRLMKHFFPKVADKLQMAGLVPEAYSTKWFIGLGVHVLPYARLLDFYEAFFQHGAEYVFRFAMCFVKEFEAELMEAKGTSGCGTILRMEDPSGQWKFPSQIDPIRFDTVLLEALTFDLGPAGDLAKMREEEGKIVAEQMAKARQRTQELKDAESDDEIVFSDEED